MLISASLRVSQKQPTKRLIQYFLIIISYKKKKHMIVNISAYQFSWFIISKLVYSGMAVYLHIFLVYFIAVHLQ